MAAGRTHRRSHRQVLFPVSLSDLQRLRHSAYRTVPFPGGRAGLPLRARDRSHRTQLARVSLRAARRKATKVHHLLRVVLRMLAVVADCKCAVDLSSKFVRQELMSLELVLVCQNLEFDLPRETVQLIVVAAENTAAAVGLHIVAEEQHIVVEVAQHIAEVARTAAAVVVRIAAAAARIAEAVRIPAADSHLAAGILVGAGIHLVVAVHSPVVVHNPAAVERNPAAGSLLAVDILPEAGSLLAVDILPAAGSHSGAVGHSHLAEDTLVPELDTAHQLSVKATAEEATAETGTRKNQF